jgi:preprotein translocase subunit SecG
VYYLLLTLLVLDSLLLATVVLLQAGKGGGLAAMGAAGAGSDSLFGTRHATTLLTKATWWTGSIFLVLCFTLSMMSGRSAQPSSILREGLQAPAAATPGLPGATAPVTTPSGQDGAPAPAGAADAAGTEPATPAPATPDAQ